MAFVHRYHFSVDEEMIRLLENYTSKYSFVVRANFKVIDVKGAERTIDSEQYEVSIWNLYRDYDFLYDSMTRRIRCYLMRGIKIENLINSAIDYAQEIVAGGWRGRVTVVVNLDVCTVQKKGEEIETTMDRAIRTENLAPLHIYALNCWMNPGYKPMPADYDHKLGHFMALDLGKEAVSLYDAGDVEKALGVMEVCGVCDRKPLVGTQISTIRCGHTFHYHCIVRHLEKDNKCPICLHSAHDDPVPIGTISFSDCDDPEIDALFELACAASDDEFPDSDDPDINALYELDCAAYDDEFPDSDDPDINALSL